MDRIRSTAVAVAVLVTTAIAVPAVAGIATAQQDQQIDECTTINESETYELNGSIGGVNESGNATNETVDTASAADNETGPDGEADDTGPAMETGVIEDDVNASACLVVEASDVTVDGNGNTLDGSNTSQLNLSNGDSVNATNASVDGNVSAEDNESVVNGIVVRPASGEESISNVTITNVTVQNWYIGVYVQNATGVTLDNVTFANNTVPGFRLVNATDLTVRDVNQTSPQAD